MTYASGEPGPAVAPQVAPEPPVEPKATPEPKATSEPRWPMALAVLTLMALSLAAPATIFGLPTWPSVVIEGALLLALVVWNPSRIDRQYVLFWRVSVVLVALVLVSTLISTGVLVHAIVVGEEQMLEPGALFLAGARIWISLNIAFALLYWQFDGDGPAARVRGLPEHPDFVFPQQASPEFAPPDWRPQFSDYLFVSLTNANAFSPADTIPFTRWAKATMESQALLSFVIIGVVIARAISDFV